MTKLALILSSALITDAASGAASQIAIQADRPARPVSRALFGVLSEDINYAADGRLHAELVQNRQFDYQATGQMTWTPTTAWEEAKPLPAR